MELKRFFENETGKIIISILLGFGLSTLFRKNCENQDCIIFKSPYSSDDKDKLYKYGNECFIYRPKTINCDDGKKYVDFA